MNYPVWELAFSGGGLLMVVIAVLHVYVAHFAVGGGLFLVLTEMKAYREKDERLLAYVRSHTRFFLLLTMVFGGITGVGIWFTISLLSPTVTSTLVHTFLFGWATEWVCFLGEIVALFLYYYRFDNIDRSSHLKIGWLYFIFAWLSLFFVNGIIDFMLTPGEWLKTGSFWNGFFNPSMLPALFFRTALSLFLAGIFGFLTAVFLADAGFRNRLLGYCSRWLIFPLPVMVLAALWYYSVLPESARIMLRGHSPEIVPALSVFGGLLPVLLILAMILRLRIPANLQVTAAFLCLVLGLVYMGAFEWIREAGRRPYLILGHTYSTSVRVGQEADINREGLLKSARWVRSRRLTPANEMKAGREIFRIACSGCHSIGGPMNDILPRTAHFSRVGMQAQLAGQGKILQYMPPFMGTADERRALARYLVEGLHGKTAPIAKQKPIIPLEVTPEAFDSETSAYVLLAWSKSGMQIMSDCNAFWSLGPPTGSIRAQLIRRGETPEIVTEDVAITYAVGNDHDNPAAHVDFWKQSKSLTGKVLPGGTGLTGNTINGTLRFDNETMAYGADELPVTPYRRNGSFNPYPLFKLEAREVETGKRLAQTSLVLPVSTEMGCRTCHGGPWRVDGRAGISDETAANILEVHDRINRTDLLAAAKKGRPRLCQSCHSGNLPGVTGDPKRLNLSAAMHGFHANYLGDMGDEACGTCHASSPVGLTQSFRGIHREIELTCVNCHFSLEEHALSLLTAEKKAGKDEPAKKLMAHLAPRAVESPSQIRPRIPWVNLPDCLNCHVDFHPPETDQVAYGAWTATADRLYHNRTDDAGLVCTACHGAAHAIYPARNPFGEDIDNLQPLQYQGTPYPIGSNGQCRVCHIIDQEDEIHHPNMLEGFRNTR
ncbi:MAG: cytochrome ubiquinol oxidase subunit I [Deltaproteobacteria bacterium]|nr:cytochrome ubiquinol oxidase subunit I [Deltaproteobacteria bacterium]